MVQIPDLAEITMSEYNVQDRAQLRKARKAERLRKENLDAAVSALLQHKHGRMYLWWLLEIGGSIGTQPFTGNALTTAFNCGKVDVGNQILAHILEVDPAGFIRMQKENADVGRTDSDADNRTELPAGDSVEGWYDIPGAE